MVQFLTREKFRERLAAACAAGDVHTVERLSKVQLQDPYDRSPVTPSGCDFSAPDGLLGQTPLHVAAEYGFTTIVKLLVDNEASVNIVDEAGWTPTHWACALRFEGGAADAVSALLEGGASVHVTTAEGDTPLHFAAANGHLDAVKLLVEQGANVNRHNDSETTPSHCAAQRGHTEIIKYLMSQGADMRKRNSQGNNPLHLASLSNRIVALEELIKDDPEALNETNADGLTPAGVAGSNAARDAAKPFKTAGLVLRAAIRFKRATVKAENGGSKSLQRPNSPLTPIGFRLSVGSVGKHSEDGFEF